MNTATKASSGPNSYLVLVLAALIGIIGGYFVGLQGPIAAQVATRTVVDPTLLTPVDEYIIAGFRCPSPACPSCELKSCECDQAKNIRSKVQQELGQGKNGTEIRTDLMAQYGDQLKFSQ
jgi:cytochrome c-type biogenesis protein CcmH/NrfF